ncbi:Zn-ribbon domain-containing OB-fold protein [Microbacterium sp. RD1]|uniref:Zn-ribbon domain-containing OB-fold protein n=1 Tax=Microbacterium sp. RD1 TaxID=3457313 RepID=UPI003FA541B5
MIDPEVERPLPWITDEFSREYFTAWTEQRLVVQHCPRCGGWQHFPRPICIECGTVPVFEEVPAIGTVYTFTIIRQMGMKPFRDEVPYAVVMVELDNGVKIMGNLTDCPIEDVRIGMAVEGYGVTHGDIGIPYWRPRSADTRHARTEEGGIA